MALCMVQVVGKAVALLKEEECKEGGLKQGWSSDYWPGWPWPLPPLRVMNVIRVETNSGPDLDSPLLGYLEAKRNVYKHTCLLVIGYVSIQLYSLILF